MKNRNKTYLDGSRFVSKRNKRIAFRGTIDTLEAEFLEAQIFAADHGESFYSSCFGEIFFLLQKIMASEVKNEKLPSPAEIVLFGLSLEEIYNLSNNAQDIFKLNEAPVPKPGVSALAGRINFLRTKIREGELLAVKTFGGILNRRDDIQIVMNRLSSALWYLFCKKLSEERS